MLSKANELAARFRDRRIAFVQNLDTIQEVKGARRHPEYVMLHRFTRNGDLRVLLALGLVWRTIGGDRPKMERERTLTRRAHGIPGLHLAQAMQSGILLSMHKKLVEIGPRDAVVEGEMRVIIENIDTYVTFIEEGSIGGEEVTLVLHKARTFYPRVFAIAGSGRAREDASTIARDVSKRLERDYTVERIDDGAKRTYVFVIKA
jgi:hypothetical protein